MVVGLCLPTLSCYEACLVMRWLPSLPAVFLLQLLSAVSYSSLAVDTAVHTVVTVDIQTKHNSSYSGYNTGNSAHSGYHETFNITKRQSQTSNDILMSPGLMIASGPWCATTS